MDHSPDEPSPADPSLDGFDFAMPQAGADVLAAQQRYRQPDWFGPPSNWLPGVVPIEVTIARTDDAVVHLSSVRVFPAGFSFTLLAAVRMPDLALDRDMFGAPGMMHGMPGPGDGALPDGLLRFAFVHADGSTASSLGGHPAMLGPEGEAPSGPLIAQHGGGGGGGDYRWEYWHWPLPRPGAMRIVCEWPGAGIERTVTTIDAAPFLEAADRAEQLWPDPPEFPGHGGPVDVRIG